MEEIFKKHPIFSDYEGSNLGNVRTTNWRDKGILRDIKQATSAKGYKFFGYKGKTLLAHRFIYECFNGVIEKGNKIENLRSVSHSINTNNPITIKKYTRSKNNVNKTRVGVYDINTGIITIYPSFRCAENFLKISRETIRQAVNDGRSKSKVFLPELSGLCLFPCNTQEIIETILAIEE